LLLWLPAWLLLLLLLLGGIPYLAVAGLGTILAVSSLLLLLPASLARDVAAAHPQTFHIVGCFAGLAVARGL
jgi:hypothetical protein